MRSVFFYLAAIVAIGASANAYDWTTNPGDGTPENPYQISEPNHLIAIGSDPDLLNKHYILMNDIVFDPNNNPSHVFTKSVIGEMNSSELLFEGTFLGNDKTIQDLKIVCQDIGCVGLFSGIGKSGTVQEVHLANIDIKFDYEFRVGGLAGWNEGVVKSCSVNGSIEIRANIAGGLVGENFGNIEMCHAVISIYGDNVSHAGGLAGWNGGFILKSYSKGSIIQSLNDDNYDDPIGGLVGYNSGEIIESYSILDIIGNDIRIAGGFVGINTGDISACYSEGNVAGNLAIGGFAGAIDKGTITACYSTGNVIVTGENPYLIGGFSGYNDGTTHLCYWDTEASGTSIGNGDSLSTELFGRTTEQMQQKTTFADHGWDFVGESVNGGNDVWRMCVDGVDYPRLSWEFAKGGDFACGDGVDLGDLEALAECWLLSEEMSPAAFSTACDANGDGVIDLSDFAVLSENWPQ